MSLTGDIEFLKEHCKRKGIDPREAFINLCRSKGMTLEKAKVYANIFIYEDMPSKPSRYEEWREDWLAKMAREAKIDLGDWYYKKFLSLWTYPSNYLGAEWYDYYRRLAGRSRDSDDLEESNFQVACEHLEAIEEESDKGWLIVHEGHWAVGWVEWIAIHKDAKRLLHEAARMRESLEDYPVLDEFHFSQLQYDNYVKCIESEFGSDTEGAEMYFDRAREEELDSCDCDSIDWDVIKEIKNRTFEPL